MATHLPHSLFDHNLLHINNILQVVDSEQVKKILRANPLLGASASRLAAAWRPEHPSEPHSQPSGGDKPQRWRKCHKMSLNYFKIMQINNLNINLFSLDL
jgi:hypothetical protein